MPQRIGVIGTFIRDTIVTLDGRTVESIGGLYHTLANLSCLVDAEISVQPLCHVGEDFYETVRQALMRFGPKILWESIYRVPQPNTQVKLIYRTRETRDEITSSPMPAVTTSEIAAVAGCDAVLVNLITGRDVDLEALHVLRKSCHSPLIYLDLHSLALGIDPAGKRYYRPIPEPESWLQVCDILQMNEREAATLAGSATPARGKNFARADLQSFGKHLVGERLLACHITLGSDGSLLFYRSGGQVHHEYCQPLRGVITVDVIGCGDAFGAAFLAQFLKTKNFSAAAHFANKVAGLNCTFMGSLTPEKYQQFVEPHLEVVV
ncbi:MAG: carbohydrate kinase family protein [candidate division KSB1 bacterium]|nr:carbohydrate kinase family protein [candidate division KSB1 bacterium]MDZ7303375.1 carbohydrate kinase family protein [candidate division KSB1 bacterium]MDZ7312307.1 carbohydrate kinase family protein [candidate division KSB1 bacterium]